MAETLRLEIVTPQAIVFSEDVDLVTLPSIEGDIGIYPQHLRLMTQLVPGEIIVSKDGHDRFLAVGEGVVEVTSERVTIAWGVTISSLSVSAMRSHPLQVCWISSIPPFI